MLLPFLMLVEFWAPQAPSAIRRRGPGRRSGRRDNRVTTVLMSRPESSRGLRGRINLNPKISVGPPDQDQTRVNSPANHLVGTQIQC